MEAHAHTADCEHCGTRGAFGDGELCTVCLMTIRVEVARGIQQLYTYLANWAAFDAWEQSQRTTA